MAPPKRSTRSASKTSSKAAPVKPAVSKKAAKVEDKKVTRGRKAASPSPPPAKPAKQTKAAAKSVPAKATKAAKSVPAKAAKAAPAPAPRSTRGKAALPAPTPAPAVVAPAKKNNKRTTAQAAVSLTPDTKAATKQAPVKKVKDEPAEPPKIQKLIVKGACAVDAFVPNAAQYQVLQVGSQIYNFVLNQSNVDANNNKFYVGQVLQKEGASQFAVFFRWGRVGVPGQNSFQFFPSSGLAIQELNKKKNAKISGGYTEIFVKYGEDDDVAPAKKTTTSAASAKKKACTLPPSVQTLINEIFDMKMIENSIKEIGYDLKKMPLGKLDDRTVKAAYTVLTDLMAAIKAKQANNFGPLSSKFYSLIPHDFGFQKMSNFILKTEEQVRVKLQMLGDLADLKIATQLLKQSDSDDSLIDQNYKKLNTEIKPVTDKAEYAIIEKYVMQGKNHYNPKVLEIFSVKRKGESDRFNKKIGNDTLLWHGSRISNFVGILSQGLRIAPPEAPSTGYNYGKGIYLADQFSKSCDYCQGNSEGVNYIMLIKSALGTPNRIEKTDYNANKLPSGTHSCWGWGTQGPPNVQVFKGVKIPQGNPVKTASKHWMQYNEFIIYDVSQAQIDYLIRFKKN